MSMREKKKFGKRTDNQRKLPNDTVIKETFGIVNSGCDSKQVVNFIERTTGHKIDMEMKENECFSKMPIY